jgi:predicted dehydrogenase
MGHYSVLIIGAGRIGATLDSPQRSTVQTHAHAFSAHPGFSLIGFVDANTDHAARAADMWGGSAFSSISDALAGRAIDAAVIAAPDEAHYDLLKMLAEHPLRLVLAEKPLTTTVNTAEEIVALYRDRAIALAVNFSRRYVPEIQQLRNRIVSGEFGRFLSGTGCYGKGTLHNGSHLIDLVLLLLGEIDAVRTVSSIQDWREEDPSCSAVLTLKNGSQFFMQAVDCRLYTIFEADLFFERRRVRIVDFGLRIELHEAREHAMSPGIHDAHPMETIETGHGNALAFAAEQMYAHLEDGSALCSSGTDGLAAQKVCAAILAKRP